MMLIWYKMMKKFSYEHNIKYNRSKIRALHSRIIGKINLDPSYANLVIKNNKIIYKQWHNCSSHGHNIEHNRPKLSDKVNYSLCIKWRIRMSGSHEMVGFYSFKNLTCQISSTEVSLCSN